MRITDGLISGQARLTVRPAPGNLEIAASKQTAPAFGPGQLYVWGNWAPGVQLYVWGNGLEQTPAPRWRG